MATQLQKADRSQDRTQKHSRDVAALRAHAAEAAGLMKALGNDSRLMILCVLVEGEQSVGALNQVVRLSQSALSQQLARLRDQGLVETRREAQTVYYRLAAGPVDRIIHLLHEIYCRQDH